jgi:glycosyltransferase involved in cell wall biosynthesis
MINVYMIDTKGNLEPNKLDVIDRHIKYAESFNRKCGLRGEKGRIVVLGRNVSRSFESKYLEIITLTNSRWLVQYFWKTRNYLSQQEDRTVTLIAGDPWQSTIVALFVKFSIRKHVLIESQLHFDFENFFKSRGPFLSKVLPRVTLVILGLVDQIRVVDRNSLELLRKRYKGNIALYFAPSLISLDSTFRCSRTLGRNPIPRLLFVGRLHKERNPSDFIRFLRLLDSRGFEYDAQIIGVGPQADELISVSSDLITRKVLRFMGELTGNELFEQYCRSDILISCAKHESYGRAMREALYLGARVLTFETTGSTSLQEEVGASLVTYVSPDVGPDQLISKIEELLRTDVDSETKQKLWEGQENILETLSDHWDTLINKSV